MANNNNLFIAKRALIVALAQQDISGAISTNSAIRAKGAFATYPILADPDGSVARSYNVAGGRFTATNVDNPATFVVDSNRKIVWSRLSSSDTDRPTYKETLDQMP